MAEHSGGTTEADGGYSPFSRIETRTRRVPELLAVLVAIGGLVVQGGRLGVLAAVVLVALWMYLQVEFVFAAGTVLFVGAGGEPLSIGAVLAIAGLGGLLAVDLARTWQSVRPVALFLTLIAMGLGGALAARRVIAPHRFAVAAAVTVGGAMYLVHRYERRHADGSGVFGATGARSERTGGDE